MAKLLKLRRGTTTQHASFTGAEGEVTIDTTKDTVVVHDGSQAGGKPLARQDMSNVPAGTILGTQLENSGVTGGQYGSSSAIPIITVDNQGLVTSASTTAVDSTKIQNGTTEVATASGGDITMKRAGTTRLVVDSAGVDVTGTLDVSANAAISGDLTISNNNPILNFTDTNNNSDFRIQVEAGSFLIEDTTNAGADRFVIDSNGTASIAGNLDVGSGCDVTGNITCTGTVDGVDIASFKTEFDNAFPSGTKMLFQQTSAPTGWTKVTSGVDNKALRVVSGTAGSGGSNAFTNTLASRGLTANAGNTTAGGNVSSSAGNTTAGGNISVSVGNTAQGGNVSIGNTTAGGNVSISNVSTGGNVNSHTLSVNEMPSHNHSITYKIASSRARNQTTGIFGINYASGRDGGQGTVPSINNTGGNGGHSHGFSGSSHNHNGSLSGTAHNHNASFSGSNHNHNANASFSGSAHNHNVSSSFSGSAHNHSISVGNLDMAVQYLDVIIASKN